MKSPILTHLGESISGNSTIRAFNKTKQFHQRNYDDVNKLILCQQVAIGTFTWYSTQMNMISISILTVSTVSCILLKDTIDPVLMAMVFSYVLSLHGSMIGFFHCMGDLEKKMVGIQRCLQILEIPQENRGQKQIEDKQWPSRGQIEFEDVQVRYRPTTEKVLKGLSFKIEGGQKIGIVGRTGAGKSTISLALTRIIEMESGKIKIDGQSIGDHSLE